MAWPTRNAMQRKPAFAMIPPERLSAVLSYSELEARTAFDGAMAATADHAADAASAQEAGPVPEADTAAAGASAALLSEALSAAPDAPQATSGVRHEIVFVDKGIENFQALIDGITQPGGSQRVIDVIAIDSAQDGVLQISEALRGQTGVDAIHIVSHGSNGVLQLGEIALDAAWLSTMANDVASWSQALGSDADILIYGCDVAGGEIGTGLVDALARITGADVAASSDATGHALLGGNWELEYHAGQIETGLAFSADFRDNWAELLPTYQQFTSFPDALEIKSDTNHGQTFQHNSGNGTYVVNQLSLALRRDNDATAQTITVTIQSSWNGTILASASMASSNLATAIGWVDFDFNNIVLDDNVSYTIRVTTDTMSGKVYAGFDNGGGYANGSRLDSNGSPILSEDIAFKIADTGTTGFVVTNANDAGTGSLRQAILYANALDGTDTITFDIVGTGPHTIDLLSALPAIFDTVSIDGWSEPDFAGVPIIVLNGTGAGAAADGLRLYSGSGGSMVRGLVIQNFAGDGIDISSSSSHLIAGNFIGTDASGSAAAGNNIGINLFNATDNIIGGAGPGDRNIISGNSNIGVNISSGSNTNNVIGNYVGTDAAGTAAVSNTNIGILIQNSSNNVIGGTTSNKGNVVSGNAGSGILLFDASSNTISGNIVGLDANGINALGNASDGIGISGTSSSNLIGDPGGAAGNIISGNGGDGVSVSGLLATGNAILGNSITASGGLAIDLAGGTEDGFGVTANDALLDVDTGANNLQNYPVIDSVTVNQSGQIDINGSIAVGIGYYRIEFYASSSADTSLHGEGQRLLYTLDVSSILGGTVAFNASSTGTLAAGEFVTATATKSNSSYSVFSDTSEFSASVPASAILSFTAAQDTYINSKNNALNYGTATTLVVDRETTDLQRALLQFDLSSLPSNAVVTSASLQMQATQIGGNLKIDVYELLENWSEGNSDGTADVANWTNSTSGSTWTTAGGTYDSAAVATLSTNATGQHSWDVTSLVQSWVSGSKTNNGLMVASPDGGGNRTATYDSSEGTVAPVLVVSYSVSPNAAPVLDSTGTMNLATINEDQPANAGTSVADIILSAGGDRITDTDAGASEGIAVTGVDDTNGQWMYSTDGSTWWSFAARGVSTAGADDTSAILLDAASLIRFEPNPDYYGSGGAVTFRAWDTTSGSAGQFGVNVSSNGGATAFSTVVDSASISVTAVNDAPAIVGASLPSISEDAANPPGDTVANLFGPGFSDVDAGASLSGILITYNPEIAAEGTWQYSTDGGTIWYGVGTIAYPNALALSAAATMRFLPSADFNGTPSALAVRGLDNSYASGFTSGATKVTSDASSPGGASPLSSSLVSLGTVVDPVNDTAQVTLTAAPLAYTENTSAVLDPLLTVTDIDSLTLTGATVQINGNYAVSEDSLSFTDALGIAGTWTSATGTLALSGTATVADYQTALRAIAYQNSSDTPGTATRTFEVIVSDGASLSVSKTGQIAISPLNDLPAITTNALSVAEGATIVLNGSNFASSDPETASGALTYTATNVTNGQFELVAAPGSAIATFTQSDVDSGLVQFAHDGGEAAPACDIEVSDGVASDGPHAASVTFTNTNDAPAISAPAAIAVDTYSHFTFGGADLITVSDADATILDVTITLSNGGLTLSQTAGLTFLAGDGLFDQTLHFTGSALDINAALQFATYRNAAGYTASETMTISVSDLGQSGTGGVQIASLVIPITITDQPTVATDTFLQGSYLEAGLDQTGAFGSTGAAPVGYEYAGATLGAIADSERDGWSTHDGDFITPGTPLENWGIHINGLTYTNGPGASGDVAGGYANFQSGPGGQSVDWLGTQSGLEIVQTFAVGASDLFVDVQVELTNVSGADLSDVYYYRNVDPDNNYSQGSPDSFSTANTVVSQGDTSGIAIVTATQSGGSYFSIMGFGENARVTRGGFDNSDPLAIYNGTGGLSQSGSSYADDAVSVAFHYATIANGQSVTLTLRYYFGESDGSLPVVDLDTNGSSGVAAGGFTANFTENGGPVSITGADAAVINPAGSTLDGMSVTITNLLDGSAESLMANTAGTSIAASYVSATGVLTLSGTDTAAHYRQVLQSLQYDNTSENPSLATRVITVTATSGAGTSEVVTATVAITAINDAPVALAADLAPIAEDTANPPGETIANLFTGLVTDTDAGSSLAGAVVTVNAAPAGEGVWEYSTDSGTTWFDMGTVGVNGLALSASSLVRFVPAADFEGAPQSLGVHILDNTYGGTFTSGAARQLLDTSVTGGSSSVSTGPVELRTLVTNVNDAPTVTNATVVGLGGTDEDTTSGAAAVSALLAAAGWSDIDALPASGIAITGTTGNGIWMYSTDGSTWNVFGGVSPASALLLTSSSFIAYDPDGVNGETASFSFVAWDQTSGTASTFLVPRYADPAAGGGTSAYSAGTASASLIVADVNDAPSLAGANSLSGIDEDETANSGTLVSALVSGTITDPDPGAAQGIAIASLDVTNGTWEYTLDGTNWLSAGTPSPTAALLLPADAAAAIRFVPNPDFSGSSGFMTYKAWDRTSGLDGGTANVLASGGATAFSFAGNAGSVMVAPVNDAPQISANAFTIPEGATIVLSATDLSAADPDTLPASLTYTASNVTHGQFELVAAPGTAITTFTQAEINAGQVQFVHDGGEAAPSYDVAVSDGALSDGPEAAAITYTNTNDPPAIVVNALAISEGASVVLSAADLSASDIDTGAAFLTYTISNLTGGQFEMTGTPGVAVTSFTQAEVDAGQVTFVHDGGEAAPSYDVTVSDGALSAGPSTATITFTNLNDAPQIGPNALAISEGATALVTAADLTAADPDTLPASLTYTVTNVVHGRFEMVAAPGVAITSFTQAGVDAGLVQFVHDAGEAAPSYDVAVSDGTLGDGPEAATITFTNVNDAPEIASDGLTISEGATVILTAADLTSADPDTLPLSLTYTVSNVANGQFEMVAAPGVAITSFTQAGVDAGQVQFVHDGGEAAPYYDVAVSDGALGDGPVAATITFTNVNDAPLIGTNALTISEGATVILIAADLTSSDPDTLPPSFTYTVSNVTNGRFEMAGAPGTAITTFTQADIDAGQVQFVHDGGEAAPSYDVAVSDGSLGDGPQAAAITYTSVNDGPVITANTLAIGEGGTTVLTAADITSADPDTPPAALTYAVSSVLNGQFEMTGAPGVAITSFTQADINAGQVQFVHNGGEAPPAYDLAVSDGALSDGPAAAAITFTKVNDVPTITSDGAGATTAITLAENTSGVTTVTAADVDMPAQSLTYSIAGGADAALFTIDAGTGLLRFVGTADFEAPSDAGTDNAYDVTVQVSDGFGGTDTQDLTITVVDVDEPPAIVANTLSIVEGATVILTASNINAIDPEAGPPSLAFVAINVVHGQFEIAGDPGVAVTAFTQAEVNAGLVRFVHDGSGIAPSYDLIVSDGSLFDGPSTVDIGTFTGLPDGGGGGGDPGEETGGGLGPPGGGSGGEDEETGTETGGGTSGPAGTGEPDTGGGPVGTFSGGEPRQTDYPDSKRPEKPEYAEEQLASNSVTPETITVADSASTGPAPAAKDSLLDRNAFADAVEDALAGMREDKDLASTIRAHIASGMSVALSAGFVSWLLRSGALAGALISSMPMWRRIDPLPVLLTRRPEARTVEPKSPADDIFEHAPVQSSSHKGDAR